MYKRHCKILVISSTKMQQFIVLVLLSGIPMSLGLQFCEGLRGRYDRNVTEDSFFELPETTKHPFIKNYVKVKTDIGLPVHVYCYPNDPRVCMLYDTNGIVVGTQISFLFKDVKHVKNYNFSEVGYIYSDIFNEPAWAIRIFFTNPKELTSVGRKNSIKLIEGIWTHLEHKFTHIGLEGPDESVLKVFVKQNCVPHGGQAYVYKLNKNTRCEKLFHFYLHYNKNRLTAVGIGAFGKGSKKKKQWYEKIPPKTLACFLPKRPPCFMKWVEKYGFPSFTVFISDRAWENTCPAA